MTTDLSPARQAELAALLDDAARFEAEYPKVADYLSMAPRLSGTNDPHADGTFDLRLIDHMTGEQVGNPLWNIVSPSTSTVEGRRVVDGGSPTGSARLSYAQMLLQSTYAYAVPSPETLQWIADFAGGARVVELGAGRGYWASQLSDIGIDVRAHDVQPPGSTPNPSFPRVPGQRDTWFDVEDIRAVNLRPDHLLLLCWPPGWGDPMASAALHQFEQSGGERLIYIGEPKGGKTADELFHDGVAERWELATTDQRFVSWWNLPDRAHGYVRRR